MNKKYKTILADPPWNYERDGKRHKGKSPRKLPSDFYPCMTLEELSKLSVKELAEDNAHLYLWVTNSFIGEGFKLAKLWGFRPITMITWAKPKMGLGWYFRGQTEHVVFAVRGRLPVNTKRYSTLFHAPLTKHSEKPSSLYSLIEEQSPPNYLELFARNKRLGWDTWGNEVKNDIELNATKP